MRTNCLILLFITGIVASCSPKKEEPASIPASIVLRINSDIQQYTGTFTPLPEKTEIGLFIVSAKQAPSSALTAYYNLKFTAGSDGQLHSENPAKLTENESYTIYAYAPFQEETDNPESIHFTHGTDVLGCMIPAEIKNADVTHYTGTLEFTHRTAQIRFIVKITDEESLEELAATSVLKATGFLPEGRLNISNGSLTGEGEPSEATSVKAAAMDNEINGKYTLESKATCFFLRPDTAQTIQLRVTHRGVIHTGSITQLFQPGESYIYTIYVGRKPELTLKATLTPWINVNETIEFN